MIIIARNYARVLEICDRVDLLQQGEITYAKPSDQTSAEELTELGWNRW